MVAAVLYLDHANHLTPLTLAYHATASRHLTSGRTDVTPPSTSVEVDSVYCPRCLTYCDAASASLGFCQVDLESSSSAISCKDCPICFSPLAVSIDEVTLDRGTSDKKHFVCHYLCGFCKWSSQECGVTSDADKLIDYQTDPLKEPDLEKQRQIVITEVTKQLERCLRKKLENKNNICDDVFKSLSNMWAQKERDMERRCRLGLEIDTSDANLTLQSWSLEALEQSLDEKKKTLDGQYTVDEKLTSSIIEANSDQSDSTLKTSDNVPLTSQQVAAQMVITSASPRLRSDLLPLPLSFRARVSRRCLAEQAAGKTGILVKPKLNPLEGDTSLRAGHGQWFKKDSSAVNSVPRVQICRYGKDADSQKYTMLLKVRNPTLSNIRLRFLHPDIPGDISERELQKVPLDPFSQRFVNARMCEPKDSLTSTEWMNLENAEDLFLDMGKEQEEDPIEVLHWEPSTVFDSSDDDTVSTLRILTTRKDTAWVEMIYSVGFDLDSVPDDNYLAFSIGLQIEVGNGSWDASLIKKRDLPEDENDIVTLNIVALLSQH